jgi:hypothetical protein
MSKINNDLPGISDEGIVVEASVDVLRKAAERVLFEFNEMVVNAAGDELTPDTDMSMGDSLVFEEDIHPLPAQVVAIKLDEDVWYVISTSEMPPGGYPTGRDATRAAQAEDKRLRVFSEFLTNQAGAAVRKWQPDTKTEAEDVSRIIDSAKRRWVH